MTVCPYYLRGTCKFGDRCRNEHPDAPGTFGNQTWISGNNRAAVTYTMETMSADVTPLKDKPLWPLSSYGPSKHEPVIISGLDESPEELRLKAVTTLKTGMTDEYTKYEAQKTAAADQIYANVRNNVRQLYEQALKVSAQAESTSSSSTPALSTSAPSAFGTSSIQSAFGGTTTAAFGKPAFGQPTFGHTGFGSPASGTSAFAQGPQSTSAFSAPSAFGPPGQTTSAFGPTNQTMSAPGPTTQATSAFGQANPSRPAFGQPSAFTATTQHTAFGQTPTQPVSAFGKPSQPTSVFGQPSQPTSAFGQPPQPTSPFAQPAQPSQSAFSQPTQPALSFSQPSQPAFGQSSLTKPASGAFSGMGGGGFSAFTSQPSTFTSAAAPSSATDAAPSQSAFGSTAPVQSAFGTAPSAPKSAFGTIQPIPFGASSFNNSMSISALPSPTSAVGGNSPFVSSPMTVTPSSEKFASGAPDFAGAKLVARMKPGADRYLSLLPEDYNEMMPADVKAAFTGAKFEWGKVPDWIPPEGVR